MFIPLTLSERSFLPFFLRASFKTFTVAFSPKFSLHLFNIDMLSLRLHRDCHDQWYLDHIQKYQAVCLAFSSLCQYHLRDLEKWRQALEQSQRSMSYVLLVQLKNKMKQHLGTYFLSFCAYRSHHFKGGWQLAISVHCSPELNFQTVSISA